MMDRAEALKVAVEHVKTLTTKGNGYQRDNVSLAEQARAVETFAKFLTGGGPVAEAYGDDGDGYLRKDMP